MARKISSDNVAYNLRRGHADLLCPPYRESREYLKDDLLSTHRADFKKPPMPTPSARGKRQELMERFLFEKISGEIAKEMFAPRAPPSYVSTTHDHFDVPGFDPDAGLQPSFRNSLYSDPALTFWSENRRIVPGVTVPYNPTRNFNHSLKFSRSPAERFDGGEDW